MLSDSGTGVSASGQPIQTAGMAVDPGGDVEAAAELYDRYAGLVYALARRIVGNEMDAEDVVQERRPSRTSSRSVDGPHRTTVSRSSRVWTAIPRGAYARSKVRCELSTPTSPSLRSDTLTHHIDERLDRANVESYFGGHWRIGIGIPLAIGVTIMLEGSFFGVQIADPIVMIAVALVLAVVIVVASYLPARTALRVDPAVALRAE